MKGNSSSKSSSRSRSRPSSIDICLSCSQFGDACIVHVISAVDAAESADPTPRFRRYN